MKKNLNKYNSKKSQSQPFSAKKLQSIKNPYRVAQNPLQSDLIETITAQCIALENSLKLLTQQIDITYHSCSKEEVDEKIDRLLGFATTNEITFLLNEAYISLTAYHEKVKDGISSNVIQFNHNLSTI
tara:strand:+ start:3601 stop:3984 length:384 start_codon:yes stop_codon:yes gene_type:complete